MKKRLVKIIIVLAILFASSTFAQMKSQVGWLSKFGVGGGFTASYMFPNYDEINKKLPAFGITEELSGGLLTLGGGGYVYLMIIDNVRIGGTGFGGTQSVTSSTNGFDKEVKYSLSGGGFTIEYTLPFIKKIGVSIGSAIGGGKLTVEMFQNSGSFSWDGAWNDFNNQNGTKNISRKIENNYFTLTPTLNVDVPLTRFFALRLGTGYQFTINETWSIENNKILTNVPNGLNGNAFFFQVGAYMGLFAF